MRIDWSTKGVLTVIAVLLGVIAIRPYVSPDTVARAQGSFAGVQVAGSAGGPAFWDTRTGDIWMYPSWATQPHHYRLAKAGASLTEVR